MANPFRTSNPALNEKAFRGQVAVGEAMTLQGTVNKTGVLLLCVVASSAWTWGLAHSTAPQAAFPWLIGGPILGMVTAFFSIFEKHCGTLTARSWLLDWKMRETGFCMGAPK